MDPTVKRHDPPSKPNHPSKPNPSKPNSAGEQDHGCFTVDLAKLHLCITPPPNSEGPMNVNPFTWLFDIGASLKRIETSLTSLHQKVDSLMATYAEAKQEWVDYTKALQDENAQLRQAVTDAQAAAQANADALAQFQADDAATDAQQLADAAQAVADDLQSTLDGLKNPPAPPEPLPEPDPGTGEVPVDPGNPSQPPTGEEPQVNPLQ